MAALVYRVHKVGLISDWKYRDYCIEMSREGYRTKEPRGCDREVSIVWKKVLNELWKEKVTQIEIAEELMIPEEEISGLLFGMLRQPKSDSDDSLTLIKNA